MNLKVHKVKICKRIQDSFGPVDYNKDFELEPDGFVDLESFLQKRNLSIYSLDFVKKLVAFVETSNSVELIEAPLYYQAQCELAKKVYLMPLDVFLSFKTNTINDKKIVLIYSVGRCGSTLLSKIFKNISEICSISEPDVYNQIRLLKRQKAIDELEARKLIDSSTIFLWRSIDLDSAKMLVIKFKSEVINIHREISYALPNSKTIFIYRNATDVIQSYDRIFGYTYTSKRWLFRFPFLKWLYRTRKRLYYRRNKFFFDQYNTFIKNGTPYDIINDLGHCGIYLLEWLLKINSYLELRKYKLDTIAIRYEDLTTNPIEVIRRLLIYCDIADDSINNAYTALTSDAHAGTNLAINSKPKYRLDKKDFLGIRDAIKRYTEFEGPDVILPGTISIN